MNQVLRDKLRTLFFKYVEVASPEISLKSFKNVDIKGKTLLVGVGKASIPYCEKIQDKIKSQYEGIIISTKIKNVSENLNKFKIFFAGHPVPNQGHPPRNRNRELHPESGKHRYAYKVL